MFRIGTLAIALIATSSASAFAHSNEARRGEQYYEIEKGRQDGSITWGEGLKLRKEQRQISKVEEVLKGDGYLSRKDRRLLHKLQNKSEKHIAQESSDGWHRVWWMPRFGR